MTAGTTGPLGSVVSDARGGFDALGTIGGRAAANSMPCSPIRSARSADHSAAATRSWWTRVRLLGGVAMLAVVVWQLGAGPFVDGLRAIDATTLALAAGIGLVTTVCSAWRWSLVARGLGIGLPLPNAVAAYYRSQFLNATLPGGVLGDVHRAVHHGREVANIGRGLRAVAWERAAGTAAFIVVTLIVLLVLPSPVQSWIPPVLMAVVVAAVVATAVLTGSAIGSVGDARGRLRDRSGRRARLLGAAFDDLRHGLLPRSVWPKVLLASGVVVAGHTATFVIAARTTGSTASPIELLPIAVLVLLAMVVPLTIGGWGPREGVAAWAFGAAGLGADQGVAAATLYGVMALVATLPGAAILVAGSVQRRTGRVDPRPTETRPTETRPGETRPTEMRPRDARPRVAPDAARAKDAARG